MEECFVGKSCFIKKLIVFTVSAPRNQFLLYNLQTTVLLHLKRSQDEVAYVPGPLVNTDSP